MTADQKIQIIHEITQNIKKITWTIDDICLLQQIARNMWFYGQTTLVSFTRKNSAWFYIWYKNWGVDFTSKANHNYLNIWETSANSDNDPANTGESFQTEAEIANTRLPKIAQEVGMEHTMDPKTCQDLALDHRKNGKKKLTEDPKYKSITENISDLDDPRNRAIMAIYLLQWYPWIDKVTPETTADISINVSWEMRPCDSIEYAIDAIHLVTENEEWASDERSVNEYKLKKLIELFTQVNPTLTREQKVEMSTVLLMWNVCGFRDLLKLRSIANDLIMRSTDSAMDEVKALFKMMPVWYQKLSKIAMIPIKAACIAWNYLWARQLITLVNQAHWNIDQTNQVQLENLFSENDGQYLELLDVFTGSGIILSSLLDKQKIKNIMNTMIYIKSNTKLLFKFSSIKKVLDKEELAETKQLLMSFERWKSEDIKQDHLMELTSHICNIASWVQNKQILIEFRDLLTVYGDIPLDDWSKPNTTLAISKIDTVIKSMDQSERLSALLKDNNSKIIDQTWDSEHKVYACKIKMNRVPPRVNDPNRDGGEFAELTENNINEIYNQLIKDGLIKQWEVLRIVVYDYTLAWTDGKSIQYSELWYTYDGKKVWFNIEHNLDWYKNDKWEKKLSKDNLIRWLTGYHAFMNECAKYDYQFNYEWTWIVRINNQNYPIGSISFNSIHAQQVTEEPWAWNSVINNRDPVLHPFLNTIANVWKWRDFGIDPSIIFWWRNNDKVVFNEVAEDILNCMREKLILERWNAYVAELMDNNILVSPDFIRHNIAIKSVHIVNGRANFEFILTDVHGNWENVFR